MSCDYTNSRAVTAGFHGEFLLTFSGASQYRGGRVSDRCHEHRLRHQGRTLRARRRRNPVRQNPVTTGLTFNPAVAAVRPSITAAPATGLHDNQPVTVVLHGFDPQRVSHRRSMCGRSDQRGRVFLLRLHHRPDDRRAGRARPRPTADVHRWRSGDKPGSLTVPPAPESAFSSQSRTGTTTTAAPWSGVPLRQRDGIRGQERPVESRARLQPAERSRLDAPHLFGHVTRRRPTRR